jgi:hypothetical protein
MLSKKISFLILNLLFSCTLLAQRNQISKQPVIYKYDSIVTDNNLKFKFRYAETNNGLITLVNIYIIANNTLIQTIHSNEYVEKYQQEKLIDYNFDGISDISVCTSCGSGGCLYKVWLYSKKDKKFHYAKELSDRFGLNIDKKNKYVLFHYWGGLDNEISDTLHYVNGKLVHK